MLETYYMFGFLRLHTLWIDCSISHRFTPERYRNFRFSTIYFPCAIWSNIFGGVRARFIDYEIELNGPTTTTIQSFVGRICLSNLFNFIGIYVEWMLKNASVDPCTEKEQWAERTTKR